jgi:hypothetical protein
MLSFSQKKTEHVIIIDDTVTHLMFDFDNVFTIKLSSTKSNQIIIKSISEGEYANHFVITEKRENRTLHISGNIAFTFPNNQDKLSAHKVHAIAVEILVPEHLKIFVSSDIGNVSIMGKYNTLGTNLRSGTCYINNVLGDFSIKTVTGDINLTANSGVVNAVSKSGTITQEALPNGKSNFQLKTAKGNIKIAKAK